jgi:hypothetical protein
MGHESIRTAARFTDARYCGEMLDAYARAASA